MTLLTPEYRWALIPVILARILQVAPPPHATNSSPTLLLSPTPHIPHPTPHLTSPPPPPAQTDPADQNEEDKEVEERLMRTVLQFAQHSHQYQQEMQARMPPGVPHPFTLQVRPAAHCLFAPYSP